jgi:transcriptional regulator with XRE-family HTH domain
MVTVDGRSIQAARALLGWSQEQLAHKAGISVGTVKRMESFQGPVAARTDTLSKLVVVLEKAGIDFQNEGEPGVRLRRRPRR